MHIVVSWDISAEGEQWTKVNDELKGCLKGTSWVKPLTTFYVVKIDKITERTVLRNKFIEVCKKYSEVNLIISPPMQGGSYGGWLPKTLWAKIEERTQ